MGSDSSGDEFEATPPIHRSPGSTDRPKAAAHTVRRKSSSGTKNMSFKDYNMTPGQKSGQHSSRNKAPIHSPKIHRPEMKTVHVIEDIIIHSAEVNTEKASDQNTGNVAEKQATQANATPSTSKAVSCEHCNKLFADANEVKAHLYEVIDSLMLGYPSNDSDANVVYNCLICEEDFSTKAAVEAHRLEKHSKHERSKYITEEYVQQATEDTEEMDEDQQAEGNDIEEEPEESSNELPAVQLETPPSKERKNSYKLMYYCKLCNRYLSTNYACTQHRDECHPLYSNCRIFTKKYCLVQDNEKKNAESYVPVVPIDGLNHIIVPRNISESFGSSDIERSSQTQPSTSKLVGQHKETPKPRPYQFMCKLCKLVLPSHYAKNVHRRDVHGQMRNYKKIFTKVFLKTPKNKHGRSDDGRNNKAKVNTVINKATTYVDDSRKRKNDEIFDNTGTSKIRRVSQHQQRNSHSPQIVSNIEIYQCGRCRINFMSKDAITIHLNSPCSFQNACADVVNCAKCGLSFNTSDLPHHSIRDHRDGRSHHFKLILCNPAVQPELKKATLYKCTECQHYFLNAKSLRSHLGRGRHDKTPIECHICQYTFSQTTLNRHVFVHHDEMRLTREQFEVSTDYKVNPDEGSRSEDRSLSGNEESESSDEAQSENSDPDEAWTPNNKRDDLPPAMKLPEHLRNQKTYIRKCRTCSKKILVKNATTAATDEVCRKCKYSSHASGQSFRARLSAESPQTGNRDIYKCTVCDLHFISRNNFKTHVSIEAHESELRIGCPVCLLYFSGSSLSRHVTIHHTKQHLSLPDYIIITDFSAPVQLANTNPNITPQIIQAPSESKKRPAKGRRQQAKIEKQKRLYKCCKCSMHFMNINTWRIHLSLNAHDPRTNVTCPICKLTFSKKSLKSHKEIHHNQMKMNISDFIIVKSLDTQNNGAETTGGTKIQQSSVVVEGSNIAEQENNYELEVGIEIESNVQNASDSNNCEKENTVVTEPSIQSTTDKNLYKCDECNVYYVRELDCYKHVSEDHVPLHRFDHITCPDCGLEFENASVVEHRKRHHVKDFNLEEMSVTVYPLREQNMETLKTINAGKMTLIPQDVVTVETEIQEANSDVVTATVAEKSIHVPNNEEMGVEEPREEILENTEVLTGNKELPPKPQRKEIYVETEATYPGVRASNVDSTPTVEHGKDYSVNLEDMSVEDKRPHELVIVNTTERAERSPKEVNNISAETETMTLHLETTARDKAYSFKKNYLKSYYEKHIMSKTKTSKEASTGYQFLPNKRILPNFRRVIKDHNNKLQTETNNLSNEAFDHNFTNEQSDVIINQEHHIQTNIAETVTQQLVADITEALNVEGKAQSELKDDLRFFGPTTEDLNSNVEDRIQSVVMDETREEVQINLHTGVEQIETGCSDSATVDQVTEQIESQYTTNHDWHVNIEIVDEKTEKILDFSSNNETIMLNAHNSFLATDIHDKNTFAFHKNEHGSNNIDLEEEENNDTCMDEEFLNKLCLAEDDVERDENQEFEISVRRRSNGLSFEDEATLCWWNSEVQIDEDICKTEPEETYENEELTEPVRSFMQRVKQESQIEGYSTAENINAFFNTEININGNEDVTDAEVHIFVKNKTHESNGDRGNYFHPSQSSVKSSPKSQNNTPTNLSDNIACDDIDIEHSQDKSIISATENLEHNSAINTTEENVENREPVIEMSNNYDVISSSTENHNEDSTWLMTAIHEKCSDNQRQPCRNNALDNSRAPRTDVSESECTITQPDVNSIVSHGIDVRSSSNSLEIDNEFITTVADIHNTNVEMSTIQNPNTEETFQQDDGTPVQAAKTTKSFENIVNFLQTRNVTSDSLDIDINSSASEIQNSESEKSDENKENYISFQYTEEIAKNSYMKEIYYEHLAETTNLNQKLLETELIEIANKLNGKEQMCNSNNCDSNLEAPDTNEPQNSLNKITPPVCPTNISLEPNDSGNIQILQHNTMEGCNPKANGIADEAVNLRQTQGLNDKIKDVQNNTEYNIQEDIHSEVTHPLESETEQNPLNYNIRPTSVNNTRNDVNNKTDKSLQNVVGDGKLSEFEILEDGIFVSDDEDDDVIYVGVIEPQRIYIDDSDEEAAEDGQNSQCYLSMDRNHPALNPTHITKTKRSQSDIRKYFPSPVKIEAHDMKVAKDEARKLKIEKPSGNCQ